ncbi:MAG: hypothetical protein ACT4QC_13835 [Planctomycetaceae bacterium]
MCRLLRLCSLALPLFAFSRGDVQAGFLSHSHNGSLPDRHGPALQSHLVDWNRHDLHRDFRPDPYHGGPRDTGWNNCPPFGRDASYCDPRSCDSLLCREVDWCRDPCPRPGCGPRGFDRCDDLFRCNRLLWCRRPNHPGQNCPPGNDETPGDNTGPPGGNDPPCGPSDPPGTGDNDPGDETDPGISHQPLPTTLVLAATGLGCAGFWNALRRRFQPLVRA